MQSVANAEPYTACMTMGRLDASVNGGWYVMIQPWRRNCPRAHS
jgi:hypothetical protein